MCLQMYKLNSLTISPPTDNIIKFLRWNTIATFSTVISNLPAIPIDLYAVIQVFRHKAKCLASVCVSCGPVKASLFGIRLIWMIKIQMGRLGHYYLKWEEVTLRDQFYSLFHSSRSLVEVMYAARRLNLSNGSHYTSVGAHFFNLLFLTTKSNLKPFGFRINFSPLIPSNSYSQWNFHSKPVEAF